ncbi:hypothetical protein EDD15DRAFT_1315096 [Pisolithus albus]|nr:hypothetical protein EDD15DRAFT_1315096 [Pisolithus albus]
MVYQPQPTASGTYRVKVFNGNDDTYWKYIPDRDLWVQLAKVDKSDKPSSVQFKWNISPVAGASDTFTIHPAYDVDVGLVFSTNNPDKYWGYGFVQGQVGSSARWKITTNGQYSKIKIENTSNVLDCRDTSANCIHFYQDQSTNSAKNQCFVFELVESPPPPPPLPVSSSKTFEQLWFQLTPEKASEQQYDVIIVGTGMGGGVIAGDFFDTNSRLGRSAKNVLVIEKGGLTFHSHCLNTSRPTGFGEDRGQQNDSFFSLFKEDYKFKDPKQADEWKAGPMFNVGGRGAAWGLFIPRIHDDSLNDELGPGLFQQLVSDHSWYRMAENLMKLYLPKTNAIHLDLMERLNIRTSGSQCQWQWGRIASEFDESNNFDFAVGAYSPIDKLLEIAMSKDRDADKKCIEHPNWKILINTEVRRIIWQGTRAAGIVVRDRSGKETQIFLKKDTQGKTLTDTQVILGAGSVGSPAILMRSGMTEELQENNGLHLTDHDIFAKSFTYQYTDPTMREKVGSMKIQSYTRLGSGKISLVNVAIDTSSFLPRQPDRAQSFTNQDFPQLVVAHILPSPLDQQNTIELDSKGEPVVIAGRHPPFSNSDRDVKELRELTKGIIRVIKKRLKITLRPTDPDETNEWDDESFFKPLELGGVRFLLDQDLKLREREGVYVCDLSIFPYSPEVNPTLTLVALALRLSRFIHPRTPVLTKDDDTVYVMNQTGDKVKVFVSNRAGVPETTEEIAENVKGRILLPGEILSRKRSRTIDETAMVYQLDFNSKDNYQPRPVLYLASPGALCVVD